MAAPQGLVCLTMMTAGSVELLGQLPAGVEIDEVIEAEFLALELGRSGDAEARAISIERGALVRVFAVAERLGERKIDAQGGGQLGCGRRLRQSWPGGGASAIWSSVLAMAVS